jgi:hypothetical protein
VGEDDETIPFPSVQSLETSSDEKFLEIVGATDIDGEQQPFHKKVYFKDLAQKQQCFDTLREQLERGKPCQYRCTKAYGFWRMDYRPVMMLLISIVITISLFGYAIAMENGESVPRGGRYAARKDAVAFTVAILGKWGVLAIGLVFVLIAFVWVRSTYKGIPRQMSLVCAE